VFDLGVDPEGQKVTYSISGPYFSVERDSGIVKLIKELDREKLSELETIITITGILDAWKWLWGLCEGCVTMGRLSEA
jgi:hypothetical protein